MKSVSLHSLGDLAGPAHTAILTIDVQRVFTRLPLSPDVATVLQNLGRFRDAARRIGMPIVVVRIEIPPEVYSAVWQRQFPAYENTWLGPGTANVADEPGFEPQPGDLVLTKHRYSAFAGTALEAMLRTREIRTLIVAGLTTDVCVGSTVRDAFQRDFHVITLADCCAELTQARHDAALATMTDCFGTVCTAAELLAVWDAGGDAVTPQDQR
jgi:ureidoacrylate peracid hydrolase